MPDDTPFKQGDKIRHKTPVGLTPLRATEGVYEVLGVHDVYVWRTSTTGMPVVGVAAVYEKVEPFFEPGKTYRRLAAWSVVAQAEEVIERFECAQVERNGSGSPVAFGRLTIPGWSKPDADKWIILDRYDHSKPNGWEEV
jgi:hypothetical protein